MIKDEDDAGKEEDVDKVEVVENNSSLVKMINRSSHTTT